MFFGERGRKIKALFFNCNPSNQYFRSLIFKTARVAEKNNSKDNKHNSLHQSAQSVPRSSQFPEATQLLENRSPFKTLIVRGQISEHISTPNGGYCLYMSLVLKMILLSVLRLLLLLFFSLFTGFARTFLRINSGQI